VRALADFGLLFFDSRFFRCFYVRAARIDDARLSLRFGAGGRSAQTILGGALVDS